MFEKDKTFEIRQGSEKNFGKVFLTNTIKFYFDEVGFAHKTNPNGEA